MKPVSAIEALLAEEGGERLPTWAEDGTDLTLIREMLSRTPDERLEILQNSVRSITEIRNALRAG